MSRVIRRHAPSCAARGVLACAAGLGVPAAGGPSRTSADAVMKRGDTAALRALAAEEGRRQRAPRWTASTALHWAVYRDDAEAADLLIARRRQRQGGDTAKA